MFVSLCVNNANMQQQIRVAVDAVVFGYSESVLHVLLIQQKFGTSKPYWALPGGLVRNDEALKDAVKRELLEETNVSVNYMEQLYSFGDDIHRDPRNRVVSVAYFALIDPTSVKIKADSDADNVRWVPVSETPPLAFDHNVIISMAFSRLRAKLEYQPVGFDLLPQEFLFSDLEALYIAILGKEIDRRNFRKKIMSFGIVEETGKSVQRGSGRPAMLFRFNRVKYNALVETGFHFEIKIA